MNPQEALYRALRRGVTPYGPGAVAISTADALAALAEAGYTIVPGNDLLDVAERTVRQTPDTSGLREALEWALKWVPKFTDEDHGIDPDRYRAARAILDKTTAEPPLDADTVGQVLHEVMCYSPIHGDEYDPCLGVNFGSAVAARLTETQP